MDKMGQTMDKLLFPIASFPVVLGFTNFNKEWCQIIGFEWKLFRGKLSGKKRKEKQGRFTYLKSSLSEKQLVRACIIRIGLWWGVRAQEGSGRPFVL